MGSERGSSRWWTNVSSILTGEWVKRRMTVQDSSAHYTKRLVSINYFSYNRILKQQSTYEHFKIAVLLSFTLPLTTSCLSCASLLPLPLLSAKAQHYNRCELCRLGRQLGEGAPRTRRERARDWAHAAAGEWGQCFTDKLDSVPK